jgi:6-pyruvoyltetrahydropterin/6-carboxytetrahydropterin synthase
MHGRGLDPAHAAFLVFCEVYFMVNPLWRLTVRSDFSSAHALRHYQGKCESMHGHNFNVELVVEGSILTSDTELLVDFKILKNKLQTLLDTLDHKDLNEHPAFGTHNPSSENIAAYIYKNMQEALKEHPVRVYSITVSEKPAQSATYMEI